MIIQIANDFNLTKVHKELYRNLDQKGIAQKIFVPLRNKDQVGRNHFEFTTADSEYIYSEKINILHRIFFKYKIKVLYRSLIEKIDVHKCKLTHATTLFSDGAIAYQLYKNFEIPYIVAVRNTDINFYFRRRKELVTLGLDILLHAKSIVFISGANKEAFLRLKEIASIRDKIVDKIQVINNGIDDYWIANKKKYIPIIQGSNFLFVGRFDKNKNVGRLIDALSIYRDKYDSSVRLRLIGGGGSEHKLIIRKIANSKKWIKYYGEIFEKVELESVYKSTDYFVMVSHTETFGLVYLEALSQGKPLLYTKGQGVDGLFDFDIGVGAKSLSIDDIVNQIKCLTDNSFEVIDKIDFYQFYWPNIAEKYIEVYKI